MSPEYHNQIEQLTKTLAKMELVMGSIRECIVWTKKSGVIQWCNSSFDSLVDRPHIEILGKKIHELLILSKKGKRLTKAHYPIYGSQEKNTPEVYEYQNGDKLQYIEIKSQEIRFLHKEPSRVSILRDVTELFLNLNELKKAKKNAEIQAEKAIDANQLKSKFLANMSHELRTPMNAIIGFTELIRDEIAGPISVEQKEYLSDVLNSAKHLLQLIDDVLDLSKIESGKMLFYPEPINLKRLIEEVRDVLSTLIAKKRIKTEIKVDQKVSKIVADPAKLKQVLYNYLSNAIKFTAEDGSIKIKACKAGVDQFRIDVKDTGIGIRKEDLSKLFIEFQQLDTGAAKKFQGTGLGLALTRRIVEAQSGQVGVHSRVGQGSNFFAILPCVPENYDRKPALKKQLVVKPAVKASSTSSTILVIEDEPGDQAVMIEILGNAGYAIEVAANGKEALRRCKKKRYDAITLDLIMPDMTGWDILHQIRTQGLNQQTPLLVVTVVPGKIASAGFMIHDYLVKPVKSEDLLEALGRLGLRKVQQSAIILVIDDDKHTLKLAKKILEKEGYLVICKSNGQSGLIAVEKERPQVVVLDLMMPEIDGFEFLHRLRRTKKGRDIPVIVWTVKDLDKADLVRLQKSAYAVISKGAGSGSSLVAELKRCFRNNS